MCAQVERQPAEILPSRPPVRHQRRHAPPPGPRDIFEGTRHRHGLRTVAPCGVASGAGYVARVSARRVIVLEAYSEVFAGSHRVTASLLARLPTHGWHGTVLLPSEGVASRQFASLGIDTVVVPTPPALRRYGRVSLQGPSATRAAASIPGYWRSIRQVTAGYDVVHALDPRGLILLGPATVGRSTRLVWQLHATSKWATVNRLGSLLADRVVTVSQTSTDAMPGLGSTTVIPPPSAPAVRQRAPLAPDPVAVVVTRLHRDKGLDVLLEAWPLVIDAVPKARLRVVGCTPTDADDDFARRVRELAEHPAVRRSTDFFGWVEHPADLQRDAWVQVQPSRPGTESFGVAIADSMALGVPAIVTDTPGLTERVEPGRSGVRVPSDDPRALAAALIDVLASSTVSRRLGDGALDAARGQPSEDDHARRWATLYESLPDSRTRRESS